MATIIRFAKTATELNDVLEVRFVAMQEAGRKAGQLATFTRKIMDHFDIYPTTHNVLAYKDGRAVATVRCVAYSPSEPLLNFSFDFRETASRLTGTCYQIDMLALTREVASQPAVQLQTLRMALGHLAQKGIAHALFLCPDQLLEMALKIGFTSLADAFDSPALGQRATAMTIEVREFYKTLMSGIKDQELLRFQEAFYYSVFAPGEILVVEGERGSTSYLIEEGEVEVLIRSGDGLMSVSTIQPGQMIGEVAMVTNEPRTASLVAKVPTTCLSFDRADFMKLMYDQPHRSLDMFKIFSKRLSESNRKLAELKK